MEAKQVSNQINKKRGERIFTKPPSTLGKVGRQEWNRLINNLYITEREYGSIIIAAQSFEMYSDLYEKITTVEYIDASGKTRKRKVSVAEYCEGKSSQNQVELSNMNKNLDNYNKIIKRLSETNSLTGHEAQEEEVSAEHKALMEQLLQ